MSGAPRTIAEAARRIAARELSPVDLVSQCLARVERLDGELHAFITLTAESALAQAREAEREIARSGPRTPLHGIPIGLKDIIDTADVRTTAHSRVLMDRVPTADAAVVERLRAAGAISLGKLATHEFALGGPSFDLPWPPARNPWDPRRFTGGSSSGTGAAVAAGLVLAGLGSDTGGSIRGPSALCGLAGLKATFGRVSRRGVVPLAWSMDHVGPMTKTAEDAAIMLQALAGHDPADSGSIDRAVPDYVAALKRGAKGLRIGVVRHFFETDNPVSPATRAGIDEALRVFEALGASVRDVRLPALGEWHAVGTLIMIGEGHAFHAKWLRERPQDYGEIMRDRMRLGALIGTSDYLRAQARRRVLNGALDDVMKDVDVLVCAAQAGEAPMMEAMTKWSVVDAPSYNSVFNLSGFPAMAVCTGFGPNGLPVAMQLAARPFEEPTLLAAAHAYEQSTRWAERIPAMARD